MSRSESIFWGLALIAGMYLLANFNLSIVNPVKNQKVAAQVAAPAAQGTVPGAVPSGHSCGAKGGGCGCGGGRKINNPPGI